MAFLTTNKAPAGASMKVLGIDASLRASGLGVIEQKGSATRALEYDIVRSPAGAPHSVCLRNTQKRLRELLETHHPDAASIEGGFFFKNAKTAMILGEVRGVVIAECAAAGVPVWEYAPRRVKQNLTGWGAAPKEQVGRMVMSVLGLDTMPPADASDALALALCHLNAAKGPFADTPL